MNARSSCLAVAASLLLAGAAPAPRATQELLDSGRSLVERSEYDAALRVLAEGLALSEKSGDAGMSARFLHLMGNVHSARSEYDLALDRYQKSLVHRRRAGDAQGEARTRANIANLRSERGDVAGALKEYVELLPLFEKGGDAKSVTQTRVNISMAQHASGDSGAAAGTARVALKEAAELGDRGVEAEAWSSLGNALDGLGDLAGALNAYEKALALERKTGNKSRAAKALANLATIHHELGEPRKALLLHKEAFDVFVELKDEAAQALSLEYMGSIAYETGGLDEAMRAYESALGIRMERGLPVRSLHLKMSDVYMEKREFLPALAIIRQYDDPLRTGSWNLLRGSPSTAIPQFKRALDGYREHNDSSGIIASSIGLGIAHALNGDIDVAPDHLEEAILDMEEQRDALPRSKRGGFLSGKEHLFRRIDAYHWMILSEFSKERAFHWAEHTKARSFIERGAGRLEAGAAGLPPSLARREADIERMIASLHAQRDAAARKGDGAEFRQLGHSIGFQRRLLDEFASELRRDHAAYAAARYPRPIRPQELRLEPRELLLEYVVMEERTVLFVVGEGGKLVRMDLKVGRRGLEDLVRAFRKPLDEPLDALEEYTGDFDRRAAERLHELLLSDVLGAGPWPGAKLVIVPDGPLGVLPFEALISSAPGARFVGDDYDVAYAQSATALTLAREGKKPYRSADALFVLADPVFDPRDPRVSGKPVPDEPVVDVSSLSVSINLLRGRGSSYKRLARTEKMAEQLAALFAPSTHTLVGPGASKAALKKTALDRYRYLVFATHGDFDADALLPGEPALVLNQVGNAPGQDGFLTMSEVMGLKLDAEVAALTACRTGLGARVSGEGVMGLGRAFQHAGARNVLMSLWSVDEEASTFLTAEFFKGLRARREPRQALREARKALRGLQQGRFDHPFFWAAFILVSE